MSFNSSFVTCSEQLFIAIGLFGVPRSSLNRSCNHRQTLLLFVKPTSQSTKGANILQLKLECIEQI